MKLLLLAALVQTGANECPAYLNAGSYAPAAAALTRPYTECMTLPYLPTEDQLIERRVRCAAIRGRQIALIESEFRKSANRRRAASDTFDWIDHIAANLPGCETRVSIAGDGTELPDAQD